MAKLLKINPVILPSDYIEFRKPKHHINQKTGNTLSAIDIKQFDSRTIFYDVFFNKDGSKLFAIGPPFLNLSKYLKKLELTINGRKTKYTFKRLHRGVICLEAKIKLTLKTVNRVNITFKNYRWSAEISYIKIEKSIPIALTTIQKDNKIHWILDWIKYYSNVLGIEQFIIYDNMSSYQSQIIDLLPDNVIIIPWNFPYGITDSHQTKFLHTGQLNHSRLRFENIDIFLNFDIDELLVIKNDGVHKLIKKYWAVIFNSYTMINFDVGKKIYSYSDFNKRIEVPRNIHKYSFKTKKYIHNRVHKIRLMRFFPKIFSFIFFKKSPIDQAYFLHYHAITTDWKFKTTQGVRKSRFETKKKKTVIDNHVKNIMKDI